MHIYWDSQEVRSSVLLVEMLILLLALTKFYMLLQAAEQEYEKEKLNERIAKLSGGVAVIQVTNSLKYDKMLVFYSVQVILTRAILLYTCVGWSTN